MTITINTDASYHPQFKVGAFAFWIVCSEGRIVQSGPLKEVVNAQDAELQAIGNALYAVRQSKFENIEHIYINTDCKYGIAAITKGNKMNGCQKTVNKIKGFISDLARKYNYTRKAAKQKKFKEFISWRYVPAHTEGGTPRRWVNNRMDELAKAALWESINNNKK